MFNITRRHIMSTALAAVAGSATFPAAALTQECPPRSLRETETYRRIVAIYEAWGAEFTAERKSEPIYAEHREELDKLRPRVPLLARQGVLCSGGHRPMGEEEIPHSFATTEEEIQKEFDKLSSRLDCQGEKALIIVAYTYNIGLHHKFIDSKSLDDSTRVQIRQHYEDLHSEMLREFRAACAKYEKFKTSIGLTELEQAAEEAHNLYTSLGESFAEYEPATVNEAYLKLWYYVHSERTDRGYLHDDMQIKAVRPLGELIGADEAHEIMAELHEGLLACC